MIEKHNKVSVIGTTSWGITLACLIASKNIPVNIWARTESEAQIIQNDREDKKHLPGVMFPNSITIDHDLDSVLENSKYILLAVH